VVRLVISYVCGSGQGSGLGSGVSLRGPRRGRKREDSEWVRKLHRHDVRFCDWKMMWSDPRPRRYHSQADMVLMQ
jgi:hypothetical protein